MTVSDNGDGRRAPLTGEVCAKPIRSTDLTDEERAKLAAEAWRLKDQEGLSTRTLEARFKARGYDIDHVTIWRMIKEAQEQAEYLDLIGPAEMRASQLGYLESAIEKTHAAIATTEVEFTKGMTLMIQLIKLQKEISGSAMPTRMQVEATTNNRLDMTMLRAVQAEIDSHNQITADRQAADGLGEYDQ